MTSNRTTPQIDLKHVQKLYFEITIHRLRLDHIVKIYLQHTAFNRIKSKPLTVNFAISFEKHYNRFRVCFQHVKERVIKRSMRGIYENNTHARPDDTPTSDCMPVTEYS